MRQFTLNDIRDAVSSRSFDRGREYQRQGRVRLGRVADDGTAVDGLVRGTTRQPYRVSVLIDGGQIEGRCSCPVGHNCKHVAALLLEAAASPQGKVVAVRPEAPQIPRELRHWIGALDVTLKTATDDFPAEVRHRLLYVLLPDIQGAGSARVSVGLRTVRLLKDGSLGTQISRFAIDSAFVNTPAQYLRPVDHAILRAIARARPLYGSSGGTSDFRLSGEDGAEILARLAATGRCRWQTPDGPALSPGAPRQAMPGWQLMPDGSQQFCCDAGAGAVALALSPPWYADPQAGCCGPLDTGLPDRMAATLLSAPPVPPAAAAAVRSALADRLSDRLTDRPALLPHQLPPPEPVNVRPRPHLTLMHRRAQRRWQGGYQPWGGGETIDLTLARVAFDYRDLRIAATDATASPTFVRDGRLYVLTRDRVAEGAALARLGQFGFVPAKAFAPYTLPHDAAGDLVLDDPDDPQADLRFLHRGVPELCAEGWTVAIDPDFPYRLAEVEDEWSAELTEGSGIDWFELSLGVTVDGRKMDLVPVLVGLIRAGLDDAFLQGLDEADDGDDDLFVPIADGTVIPLPAGRLRPILAALLDLFAAGGIDDQGAIRFSPVHAAELAALEEATDAAARLRWLGAERLRELGRMLRDFTGIPTVPAPPSFRGALRGYQQQGLNWLQFLAGCGLGGVLADDMGLGKTVQTLAHLAIEKAEGRMDRPSLVVAPTSLMANWRMEAQRFAPDLRVLTLHGPDRKGRFDGIAGHDLVLTTYPLLPRDREVLLAREWHMVILDEAHMIKNPQTTIAKVAQLLRARHRLCLTGTPVENHLGELWSLFHFLNPGLLGDWKQFTRTFRHPIEKLGNRQQQALLRRRVRPFLLRRTKAEVAAELPAKTELVEPIELDPGQRDVYETIRLAMHKKVRDAIAARGLAQSRIIILDALLKLRQACCDPRLLKLDTPAKARAQSAKLQRLMEMLPELLDEGRRVLLFSQFTSMLALIEAALAAAGIDHVTLTGQTRDRATPIKRFQSGEVPLFLISLKAGGTGLNLTAADTVIHYDPWWNPAVEAQATDRAHRIGQDKPVFVHKLIALDSIEEKMLELQTRKRALAASLFDPDAKTAAEITEDDIAFLLSAA